MDITDIQDEVDDLRPEGEDAEDSFEILVTNIGQVAKGEMLLDGNDLGPEETAEYRRDMIAAVITACMEYAAEHDIDMGQAIEERLDHMRDLAQQRQAMEEKDAAGIVDAITGGDDSSEEDSDESSGRGFY